MRCVLSIHRQSYAVLRMRPAARPSPPQSRPMPHTQSGSLRWLPTIQSCTLFVRGTSAAPSPTRFDTRVMRLPLPLCPVENVC